MVPLPQAMAPTSPFHKGKFTVSCHSPGESRTAAPSSTRARSIRLFARDRAAHPVYTAAHVAEPGPVATKLPLVKSVTASAPKSVLIKAPVSPLKRKIAPGSIVTRDDHISSGQCQHGGAAIQTWDREWKRQVDGRERTISLMTRPPPLALTVKLAGIVVALADELVKTARYKSAF